MNAKQRVLASQCGQSVASAVFASALSDCRCRRSPKERPWSQHPLGIRRMSANTGADALADAQIVAFSGSPLRFPYRLARGRAGTLFIPQNEAPPNGRYSVTKIFGHQGSGLLGRIVGQYFRQARSSRECRIRSGKGGLNRGWQQEPVARHSDGR